MTDRCCFICRTPFGCAVPNCTHHLESRRTADADANATSTHRDPTGNRAVANVMRERKQR